MNYVIQEFNRNRQWNTQDLNASDVVASDNKSHPFTCISRDVSKQFRIPRSERRRMRRIYIMQANKFDINQNLEMPSPSKAINLAGDPAPFKSRLR